MVTLRIAVVAFISNWLRDGEVNAITRYRHPWVALISWSMGVALSPALFVSSPFDRLLMASVVLLLFGFGILSWKRRIAILTPTTILFRPTFGKPLQVPLSGIKRVSRREEYGEGGWIEVWRLEFIVGGFFEIRWGYSGDLIGDLERLIAPPV